MEKGFEDFFQVDVLIEEQGPFSLVLDTGAGLIVLSDEFARPLLAANPRRTRPFIVVEDGHELEIGRVFRVSALTLGEVTFDDVAVVAMDFGYWDAPIGKVPPGLIGLNGFQEHFIELDFRTGEFTISKVVPEVLPSPEASLPFRWSGGAIHAEITVAGQKTWAVVDSGSSLGFEIPSSMETPTVEPWEPWGDARDLGALRPYEMAQIAADARIGDAVLSAPWVFSSPEVDFAYIGIDVLRHFRMTLDTKNGRLWLEGPENKRLVVEKPKPSKSERVPTPPSASAPDR